LILKSQKEILSGKQRKLSRSRSRSSEKNRDDKKKKLKWVIPGIIIRVVSKKVAHGKLYNKKLKVTDVVNSY